MPTWLITRCSTGCSTGSAALAEAVIRVNTVHPTGVATHASQ
jgi:hypothetical protein